MSKISEIKQSASKYPGSYELGASGRAKINGSMVSFIAYTNPQNISTACYIHYTTGGRDYGITSRNLNIYDTTQIKKLIELDLC